MIYPSFPCLFRWMICPLFPFFSSPEGTQLRESWWGALEVGGSCLERVASVKAYTDCHVASWWDAMGVPMFGGWFLACFCEERKVAPAHCLVDFRVCVGYMRHIVGMLVRSANVPFSYCCLWSCHPHFLLKIISHISMETETPAQNDCVLHDFADSLPISHSTSRKSMCIDSVTCQP